MLVANTIRLSIYARRREIEVMKLVGATNWFIRWPFVLEGLIVGLFGAALAVGILWAGKLTIIDPLAENFVLIDNFSTIGFVPLDRHADGCGGRGLRARQRGHAAPLPPRLRQRSFIPGFVAGAVTALAAVALIAAIAGELDGDSDLTSQASEVIRDDYFKQVEDSVLDEASVDGIIRELRRRYDDRFSHYLNPRELQAVRGGRLGPLLGRRPDHHRRQAGAAGGERPAGHTRRARRDRGG